ncbi:MAG: thioredoxin [Hyphomicrobiaceae bacterium]|nr:thioredoxin [Hyphomicrobiaceae bacterium]
MEPPIIGSAPGGDAPDLIKDTSTQAFKADVLDASKDALVLVDFWAPWCGPCKQLTPVLEKVVREAGGTVRLVKLNIDEHPAIPGQMGVQSIPAVFAFKAGRPVDGFMGALPESEVKAFVARHAEPAGQSQADADIAQAETALEAGDVALAAQIFGQVVQEDKTNARAVAGLAGCYVQTGDVERAEQTLGLWDSGGKSSPEIDAVRATLDLARKADEAGDVSDLRAKVESNPSDHQARCDLAIALNANGDRSGAAEQLLEVVASNRDWNDGAARNQLLQFFEAWGSEDPATVEGRQKLSSLLFA